MLFVLLFVLGIVILIGVCVFVPVNVVDLDSPLNMVIFQSPGTNRYSSSLVNLWIPKTWRTDDTHIPCRLETFDRETTSRKLIVYSHGNAEDLLACSQFIRELSEYTQMDVVSWDYSGYGLNPVDRFERSVEGVNLSLKTIIEYFVQQKGYMLENIVLWGYSLGTGPTIGVASRLCKDGKLPGGVILFAPYSSILDVVRDHTHPKVAEQFTERWDSKESIKHVTCPVLLMHGQSDGMIPCKHSQTLKSKIPGDKSKLVLFPNIGHTQFSWQDTIKEVVQWLKDMQIIV